MKIAPPPRSLEQLLDNARGLAGRSIGALAAQHRRPVPDLARAKGWVGQFIEACLGGSAGSDARPDFPHLGVELKTLPVDARGAPLESTYVCQVPLAGAGIGTWRESWLYRKLHTVLWVPVLTPRKGAPAAERIVGSALLWRLEGDQEGQLRRDWEELMELVSLGRYADLSARSGTWLQIRPKAANAAARTRAVDPDGRPLLTNPRGFYLRTAFTRRLFQDHIVAPHARSGRLA